MYEKIYAYYNSLFLVDGVFGQATKRLTQFSTETESYIEELNEFMLVSPSEDVKKLMKQFSKIWHEEVFSTEKRQAFMTYQTLC